MRDIKFRAWNMVRKEMVNDFSIHADGRVGMFDPASSTNDEIYDHLIVMQYTGLKANGVEIYEGDFVRHTAVKERNTFNIIFRNGRFIAWSNHIEHDLYLLTRENDCEVIGNIYENPELLK